MIPYHKDEIARLRADAKHFRELAAGKRKQLAELKARPIGAKDPIAALRAQDRITEYVRSAQERDQKAAGIRAMYRPAEVQS